MKNMQPQNDKLKLKKEEPFINNMDYIFKIMYEKLHKELSFMSEKELTCFIRRILKNKNVIYEINKYNSNDELLYKKICVLTFYENMMVIRPFIRKLFECFNIDLDNKLSSANIELIFELQKALLFANKENLISIIANLFSDVKRHKTVGKNYQAQIAPILCDMWAISFEKLLENFNKTYSYLKLKKLRILKEKRNNLIDNTLFRLQCCFREDVEVIFIDINSNIIFSRGKKCVFYYLKKLIYPQINEMDLSGNDLEEKYSIKTLHNNFGRTFFHSKRGIQFSDSTILTNGYHEIYPMVESNKLYGYLMFYTSKCNFDNDDYNYIDLFLKQINI